MAVSVPTIDIPVTVEGLDAARRWLRSLAGRASGTVEIVCDRDRWVVQLRHESGHVEMLSQDEEIRRALADAIKRLMRRVDTAA